MTTINELTNESFAASDKLVKYSGSNSVDRSGTISQLQTYMQNSLNFGSTGSFTDYDTQYNSPSDAAVVQVTDSSVNTHLILTPTGTLDTMTIKLPATANLVDKQDFIVNSSQAVTTLTVDGNGTSAVAGEPATLTATGFFRLKYDAVNDIWNRIG